MPRTLALVVVEVVFVSPLCEEEEANKELKKLDILINIVYLDIYMSKSLDLQNQKKYAIRRELRSWRTVEDTRPWWRLGWSLGWRSSRRVFFYFPLFFCKL